MPTPIDGRTLCGWTGLHGGTVIGPGVDVGCFFGLRFVACFSLLLSAAGCPQETTPPVTDTAPLDPIVDNDDDGVAVELDCDDDDGNVWSDEPFEGVLSDPEEIASFCDGYCRRNIQGDLVIREGSVTQGLECVRRVTGDLVVAGEALDVTGLSEINYVGGSVRIEYLRELDRLTGLQFSQVDGDVSIRFNIGLERVGMFRHVESIGGDLIIEDNDGLEILAGRALQLVGGAVSIRNNLRLSDVTALSEVLEVNGGGITITASPGLGPLNAFGSLNEVAGPVVLDGDIGNGAFASLTSVPELQLVGADEPRTLDGFIRLQSVEGDFVINHGSNTGVNVFGFNSLNQVGGDLIIEDASVVSAHFLGGLRGLRQVGGTVRIRSGGVVDVSFLERLTTVNSLQITGCPRLATIRGSNELRSIPGDLVFVNNASLASITGFTFLESVGSDLQLKSNPLLSNIVGLNGLERIGGDFELNSNWHELAALDGLERLTTIGGDLSIQYNYGLTDVTALYNLERVGEDVCFYGNPRLTQEAAFRLVKQIEEIGGNVDYELQAGLCDI